MWMGLRLRSGYAGKGKDRSERDHKVSRKEFGILYNPMMESGGVAVSDEVAIEIEAELFRN